MSNGSGEPAFGGRLLSRKARTIRPSARCCAISLSHKRCSLSTRADRPSRNFSASSRDCSSRAPLSAATTTLRISRRSTVSIPEIAASARSRHSAAFKTGVIFSTSATSGSDLTFGIPSASAILFIRAIALRTPGTPPLRTSSASPCWISGISASAARRFLFPGRKRGALGVEGGFGRSWRARTFRFLLRWSRGEPVSDAPSRRLSRSLLRRSPRRESARC